MAEETTQMDVLVEEFERILMDEDNMLDGTMEHRDADDDNNMSNANNDDIIRQFKPGKTKLQKYRKNKKFAVKENSIEVEESLKKTISLTYDYLKSSITNSNTINCEEHFTLNNNFINQHSKVKEEFVHICEKLMETVENPQNFVDIMEVYNATTSMINLEMSLEDSELANQTSFIIETVTHYLKIGLDFYTMADAQDLPLYKIRHIKCGVKLAEWVCHSEYYLKYIWNKKFNLHEELLNLYNQDFMALSIKLMVLKALDTYLLHRYAVYKFLIMNDNNMHKYMSLPISATDGYKVIVEAMQKTTVSPIIKLSLHSIFIKIKLYEVLYELYIIFNKPRNVPIEISTEEINLIMKCLNQILKCCKGGPFTIAQLNRFLPVATQFERMRTDSEYVLITYFKMFNLLQYFIELLTYPSTLNLSPIKSLIFEIVSVLLESSEGLQYLSEDSESINVLLKCFPSTDEQMQYGMNECLEVRSHNLRLKIAYKLQSLYIIEYLMDISHKHAFDCGSIEIIDQLRGLIDLTFSPVGKFAVGEVLGMGDNIKCLLEFLKTASVKVEWEMLQKSNTIGYIVDLLYFVVVTVPNIHMLEKYSTEILSVLKLEYDDIFAPKIKKMRSYMAPLENIKTLSYDNIFPFLETIKGYTNTVISNPGHIITCLRIIEHLGISKHNKRPIKSKNSLCNYVELKHEHVIEQLDSLDGTTILINLLQTLCSHFEQLGLETYTFNSDECLVLANIVYPTILLFTQMMANIVQCRNTKFNDLTFIPVLLKTYNLLNSFPANASNNMMDRNSKIAIIDTLLVYTRPVADEVHENDSSIKSLWSQMLGEVIRFINTASYTYVSGLLILSELLPLPLPIQTQDELTQDEIALAMNLRKLSSTHLYPHSSIIQDSIKNICISTQPQILNLLRRVCVQISDLGANSALMIARGIVDTVFYALMSKDEGPCSSHVARLLNFLACLVTHGTVKCAVLHLIHTNSNVGDKTEDKYSFLIPAFIKILKMSCNTSQSHLQAQECILRIVQSFCDIGISLIKTSSEKGINPALSNAIPIRQHLLSYITVILDHLACENSFNTYLHIMKTLLLLTQHDYGFYHLKENLLTRNALFLVLLKKLAQNCSKPSHECLSTLSTLVEFLRVSLTIEENDDSLLYNPRSMTLTIQEVKDLIGWKDTSDRDGSNKHPFFSLEELLKKQAEEDINLETPLNGLVLLLQQLSRNMDIEPFNEFLQEVELPTPEPLLTQFSYRSKLFGLNKSRADVKNHPTPSTTTPLYLRDLNIDRSYNVEYSVISEEEMYKLESTFNYSSYVPELTDVMEVSQSRVERRISNLSVWTDSVSKFHHQTSPLFRIIYELDRKIDSGNVDEVEEAIKELVGLCIEYRFNPELLYRIGKAHYIIADKSNDIGFIQRRLALGIAACSLALTVTYNHAEAHKWFAALIGIRIKYGSLKEKIEDGHLFKVHVDLAMWLNPTDPWPHYMLGRFNYELAGLKWYEKALVATLFKTLSKEEGAAIYGDLPDATYADAYNNFAEADRLAGVAWKDYKWMLAKCKIEMGHFEEAVDLLHQASLCRFGVEDKIDVEIKELLKKYNIYD